jgi:hypothetical protein
MATIAIAPSTTMAADRHPVGTTIDPITGELIWLDPVWACTSSSSP